MTLPSFLSLGAMRSGSTWLDSLLRKHPRLYLPRRCKEVHFFDRHYHRGVDWYETFFPAEEEASEYARAGESTPSYLSRPEVPACIQRLLPGCLFLIILRNPADRAYSHFKHLVQHLGTKGSFQELLRRDPQLFELGRYVHQIKRYFELFPRENFRVLFFEQAVRSPQKTCRELAEFLSVDADQFDLDNGGGRKTLLSGPNWSAVNKSSVPRFPRTYRFGRMLARNLRKHDQDWIVNAAMHLGLRHFFREGTPFPPVDAAVHRDLMQRYADDIHELESLLDVDLGFWRNGPSKIAA